MSYRNIIYSLAKFSIEGLMANFKNGEFTFVRDVSQGYPKTGSDFRTEDDLWLESQVRPLLLMVPMLGKYQDVSLFADVQTVITNVLRRLEVKTGQAQVEFAYLTLCIETVRQHWVDPIQDQELQAKYERLLSGYADLPTPDNNWLWFALYPAIVCGKFDRAAELLKKIDTHHKGDGWYADGTRFDYYSAWSYYWWPFFCFSFHLTDDVRSLLMKSVDRFQEFIAVYKTFFDDKGRVPRWGRSACYSHAVTAPFVASAFYEDGELCSGSFDSLVARNLIHETSKSTYWNVLGPGHIPSMRGYSVDAYSCVASPMWAFKTYWCLLLPEDSPFWKKVSSSWGRRAPYRQTSFGLTTVNTGDESRIVFPQRVVFPDADNVDLRYLSPRPSSEN